MGTKVKKVFQTKFGLEGNCFSAVMASLYEEPIENWECVNNSNPSWRQALQDKIGLEVVEVHLNELTIMTLRNDEIYILGCVSENKLPHVILAKLTSEVGGPMQFEILHDPLGELKPHYHPDYILLLCKKFL